MTVQNHLCDHRFSSDPDPYRFSPLFLSPLNSAQYNSFRDPLVIPVGSVPLAMFGALIFTFLKKPDPNAPFWTAGWTTTLNI
jgi:hypothetical protein